MKVEIENYRGWDISFDTDKEMFHVYSNTHDTDQEKKSYSAVKKYIDDFIKENNTFKSFKIIGNPLSYYIGKEPVTVIGIRKDGRFVQLTEKGEQKQISDYNEGDYILIDPNHLPWFEELKQNDKQQEELRLERKGILEKFAKTIVTLATYKKKLLGL